MKRGHIALALVTLLSLPVFALAAEVRAGQEASINSSEKIATNTYLAGGSVSSSGSVTGDLMAAGGTISISGPVSQDLFVAGGNINISSTVGGDLRVGGGNVLINGKVGGDILAGSGQISITGPGVGGDVIIGGGTVHIDAPVTGNVRIAGGQVIINAPVSGNVEFRGNTLELGENAVIHGDLKYTASKEVTMGTGAHVDGKTDFTPAPVKETKANGAAVFAAIASIFVIGKFFATLACALVLGLIFKRFSNTMVTHVVTNPLLELGRGFGTVVLIPVASFILLLTVLGIPIGLLGFLTFGALMIFGMVATPIVAGSLVHGWLRSTKTFEVTWLSILSGTIVMTILAFIPFIGWIANCVLFLMTIGAAVNIKWGAIKEWK